MKYQQWRETCTTEVLPQRYSVTRGVLVSSKQSSEAAIVTVLDASKQSSEAAIVTVLDANKILAPVNIVKETGLMESRTTLVAQNVIQSIRRNFICPQTACILSHVPSLDLTQSSFCCSIITPPAGQSFKFLAFHNYQLSTVNCPEEDWATTCSLPLHPSGLRQQTKINSRSVERKWPSTSNNED